MKIKWSDSRLAGGSQLRAADIVAAGTESDTVDCVLVERLETAGCREMHFEVRNANDQFQGKRQVCFDRIGMNRIVRP